MRNAHGRKIARMTID